MKALRAAVIGVGYLGRFHAQKYAALADTDLVAVVDTDLERAREVAAECGCRALGDHRALGDAVDLVSVVVPTQQHRVVAADCLAAGYHVLIEKPIARSLAEADALVEHAARARRVLQVGHLERFNPAFAALTAALHQPLYVEAERLSSFKQRGIDVNVVLDLMIHDLDLVLALVRSEVVSVSACGFKVMTDAIDIANARLEFADGCVANLSASRVSQVPVRKLRVFQADTYLSADLQAARLRVVQPNGDEAGLSEDETAFEARDALLSELESFVRTVREGGAPAVSGEDGRRALALALEVGRLVNERWQRFAQPMAGGTR